MSRKRIAVPVLAALVTLALAAGAHAGGRARVTIDRAPARAVAGQPFEVRFTVRPELGSRRNVEPVLKAVRGDRAITVQPVALEAAGRYAASIALPGPGEWTLTVDSRYCETRMAPLTVTVVKRDDS